MYFLNDRKKRSQASWGRMYCLTAVKFKSLRGGPFRVRMFLYGEVYPLDASDLVAHGALAGTEIFGPINGIQLETGKCELE